MLLFKQLFVSAVTLLALTVSVSATSFMEYAFNTCVSVSACKSLYHTADGLDAFAFKVALLASNFDDTHQLPSYAGVFSALTNMTVLADTMPDMAASLTLIHLYEIFPCKQNADFDYALGKCVCNKDGVCDFNNDALKTDGTVAAVLVMIVIVVIIIVAGAGVARMSV